MADQVEKTVRNFNLASYIRAKDAMIATNDNAYNQRYSRRYSERTREYSKEEVQQIIESGSLTEQQKLSRNYFYRDGYYKQIVIYYATLLKYAGILIPNITNGKDLSTPSISKRYYSAVDYVERIGLPTSLTNWAQKALVDGSYYGVIVEKDKSNFTVLDLPSGYCCSRFKDTHGNDIIEFDVSYFNTIADSEAKKVALSVYPKVISKAYKDWDNGKSSSHWVMIPSDVGLCFPFFDGRPMLLSVIPAAIDYDKAVEQEDEKQAEEMRKIIVQKIPHLTDGRLVFEPNEAKEMHQGTVDMLKGNSNLSVLTTYADVDSVVSKTVADNSDDILTRIEQNIYAQAGVSGQIFAATSVAALNASLNNDLALMMYLAQKFARFITNIVNEFYSNGNISFKYSILPISYYNTSDYITDAYKLACSGYSFIMPAMAMGLSQRDLSSVKDLENNLMDLNNKLKPLASAFTSDSSGTAKESGGQEVALEDKSDKTIANEESFSHKMEGGS